MLLIHLKIIVDIFIKFSWVVDYSLDTGTDRNIYLLNRRNNYYSIVDVQLCYHLSLLHDSRSQYVFDTFH